jgi:ribosomal protein L40E
MMRHSWSDISQNVSICRQCGMKRVENKQRNFRTSRPVMTYTRDDMMQTSAGDCANIWPDHINPEWRTSIYKEPSQERFVFPEDDCPGHVASVFDPKVCGRCGVHIMSLMPPDEPERRAFYDDDMNDDIPF